MVYAIKQKLDHLRGANVVVISAGYEHKRFIFDTFNSFGVNVIAVDSKDCWLDNCENLCQRVFVDLKNFDATDSLIDQIVHSLKDVHKIDAICTFKEIGVPIVSRLCKHFGLPGPEPFAVNTARNKFKTREVIRKMGLDDVRSVFLCKNSTFPDLKAAAKHVGFPAVLKPTSCAASIGVEKIQSLEELTSRFEISRTLFQGQAHVQNGSIVVSSEKDTFSSNLIDSDFLLEEYIGGQEVDVDMVVHNSVLVYSAVTDNGPTLEPWFNETVGVLPSALKPEQQNELISFCFDCVKAIGFTSGVFHVEAKYDELLKRPRLIEVNCRMGGGPVHWMHKHWSGVELCVEQLLISLGHYRAPEMSLKHIAHDSDDTCSVDHFCGYVDSNVLKTGLLSVKCDPENVVLLVLRKYETMYKTLNFIFKQKTNIKPGDYLVGPDTGFPSWIANISLRITIQSSSSTSSSSASEGSMLCMDICNRIFQDIGHEINLHIDHSVRRSMP